MSAMTELWIGVFDYCVHQKAKEVTFSIIDGKIVGFRSLGPNAEYISEEQYLKEINDHL